MPRACSRRVLYSRSVASALSRNRCRHCRASSSVSRATLAVALRISVLICGPFAGLRTIVPGRCDISGGDQGALQGDVVEGLKPVAITARAARNGCSRSSRSGTRVNADYRTDATTDLDLASGRVTGSARAVPGWTGLAWLGRVDGIAELCEKVRLPRHYRLRRSAIGRSGCMIQTYGVRIGWAVLPARIRERVEAIVGGPVVRAVSQAGGFSPGTADRVVTADGRRAFVKAVSTAINVRSVELARAEAHVTARLPAAAPVPRLLGSIDDGEWVVLVHEDVEGRHPRTPWVVGEIRATVRALRKLASSLTPSPVAGVPRAADHLAPQFAGWDLLAADRPDDLDPWVVAHLAELRAAAARGLAAIAAGSTLAHCDVRADNLLVRPDGSVVVVDWPYGSVGPAWLDTVLLAMNVLVHGGPGDRLLAGVDPRVATDVIAGVTGGYLERSRQPSPGIPHVRAFQRAQADAVLPWLRERLRLDRQMGAPAHLRGVGNPGH